MQAKLAVRMHSSIPSDPPGDDAEIVRLLRERETAGLRRLLAVHGPGVRTCVRKMLGDLSESEMDDVVNKAAFHAWRSADSYDPKKGTLRAWFLVIARNAGRGILREQQRRGFEVRGEGFDEVAAAPSDELPSTPPPAFVRAVHECIEELPRLQRSIIEADLRCGDVANADELARTLQTTKNSIYVSRSLARRTLRRKLLAQGYVPGDGRSQPLWS
jgi:RNA polymerase sigma factor (sigma-70 family)